MLAAFFAAVMASAADYFWENGSADWGSTASYRDKSGKIPAALPGETDVLNLSESGVLRLVGTVKGGGAALPLTFLNTDTSGNIAAWDVNVSGRTGVYKARADRQGVLRIYRRAHSIIVR
jgi:hypothetical protein